MYGLFDMSQFLAFDVIVLCHEPILTVFLSIPFASHA